MNTNYTASPTTAAVKTLLDATGFTWASTAVAVSGVSAGTGTCYDCLTIDNCIYCTSASARFNSYNDPGFSEVVIAAPVTTPYCYKADKGYQVTNTGTVQSKYTHGLIFLECMTSVNDTHAHKCHCHDQKV